jgi:hypothetical protein
VDRIIFEYQCSFFEELRLAVIGIETGIAHPSAHEEVFPGDVIGIGVRGVEYGANFVPDLGVHRSSASSEKIHSWVQAAMA